ncbi:DUF6 domain containing protein [Niveomyces insectorum RCEF 264]|uniref:DUF6 domain containing protein n=1 Tax=Niveomyces insectorum RCEF 264 TaxID=1081102 RepID=A0A167Z5T0_9HYPO|nr:DUF6 domain containing protein [Niveomyces insectorum RCEF 264]
MSPYLPIPQTPSAKTQFEEHVVELSSVSSDRSTTDRPWSPFAVGADDDAKSNTRMKTVSRTPPPPTTTTVHHLGPPDAFHRISIGSASDARCAPPRLASPSLSFRAFSPSPSISPASRPSPSPSPSPASPSHVLPPFRGSMFLARIWARNRAVLLVCCAQLFGALMNLAARLLELEGDDAVALHPIQLLFMRMVVTTVASCAYMVYYRVPDFPFGRKGLRTLLVVRGVSGFFGIFGMWFSMAYLPLAEATVLSFLAPSLSSYICHVLLHEPFTRKAQVASLLALAGVVLIARPDSLVGAVVTGTGSAAAALTNVTTTTTAAAATTAVARASSSPALRMDDVVAVAAAAAENLNSTAAAALAASPPVGGDEVTSAQRLVAIAVALLGVVGGSCALVCIRAIGTRVHPLVSVNYFATWCLLVTGTVMAVAPALGDGHAADLRFVLPHSLRQWLLLAFICICGFCTQFLSTMGLGMERSNRATAMVYTHMLFAAGFDRFVFGHEMGLVSLVGCGLIVGSALWAALSEKPLPDKSTGPAGAAAAAAAGGGGGEVAMTDIEVAVLPGRETRYRSAAERANDPQESIPILAAAEDSDDEDDVEDNDGERTRFRQYE